MKRTEINALFERYGAMVYRRARYILGNHEDAEEATQDIFVRAIRSKEGFQGRAQVSTWLYKITTNHCLNRIRDRKRRRELWEEHMQPPAPLAPSPDKMMLVRQLLAEADEECAKAAVYVFVDGMSHQEASKLLGVSRRTVGNLLERFKRFAEELQSRSAQASHETSGGPDDR